MRKIPCECQGPRTARTRPFPKVRDLRSDVPGKLSYRLLRVPRVAHIGDFRLHQHHRGLPVNVVCTAPQSDSLTDFSTENFFEIAIAKCGLRGVGRVDAGERFRCLCFGALLQSTAAAHSHGSEAGGGFSKQTQGIPADTWSLSELWPISWRLENTVEANSPTIYHRPGDDHGMTLRPYHTDTVQPKEMDRNPFTKEIGPFLKMQPSIRCTRQPVLRTSIAQ